MAAVSLSPYDPAATCSTATVAHLRLKVLFRRQWTDRDGHLYPIPEHVYRDDEKGWPRLVDVVLR